MKITYPTWKVASHPTPNETLWICPKCGKAAWGAAGVPGHCYSCEGRKGGFVRCRAATEAETAEGKAALKKIIGEQRPPAPTTPPVKAAPLPAGVKPLYVLKFVGGPYDGLYFSRAAMWQGVTREQAQEFDHKESLKVQGHLKQPRLALATTLEPALTIKHCRTLAGSGEEFAESTLCGGSGESAQPGDYANVTCPECLTRLKLLSV